jgi:hypothetical protein
VQSTIRRIASHEFVNLSGPTCTIFLSPDCPQLEVHPFDLGAVQSFVESVRRSGQHHSSRSHSGASPSSAMQREGAHEKPSFSQKLGFLSLCSLPTRGSSKVMHLDRAKTPDSGSVAERQSQDAQSQTAPTPLIGRC